MKEYKSIERNTAGIQHETIRKKIDKKYNDVHDELSKCYYEKKPFRDYGILDKETFDKLHGLIFLKRDLEFVAVHTKEKVKNPNLEDHNINVEEISKQISDLKLDIEIK